MNKKKNGRNSSIWVWAIIFQFTFAPLASAESDAPYTGTDVNAEATARQLRQMQTQQAFGTIFNTAGQIMQQMQNQQQQQAIQQQSMAMKQSLQAKPLRDDFFPGCAILQAKSNKISETCDGTPDINKGELYKTISQVAAQNANLYENFSTTGNTEQGKTAGIDCYDQTKDNQLRPALEGRVAQIDKLINDLNINHEKYLLKSEKDLEELKGLDAQLNGEAGDNKGKYLADARFGEDFGDNVCATVMGKADFDVNGSTGGLKKIQEVLQKKADGAKATKLLSQQQRYEAAIRKSARKVSEKLGRMNPKRLSGVRNISDKLTGIPLGMNESKALSRAFASGIESFQDNTQTMMEDINGEKIAGEISNIDILFHKNQDRFDEALTDYTHKTKKSCFNKALKDGNGGASKLASRLFKASKSEKARSQSDSKFKQYVKSMLKSDYSMDEILKRIKAKEKKSGRGYAITFGKSSVIGETQFSASKSYKVSDLLSLYVNNCETQFNLLPATQIQKAREYRTQFNTAKDEMLGSIQNSIIDKMINCTDDPSFGEGALSCTKEGMDPKGGEFCLSGAVKCASNMNACVDKAQHKINVVRMKSKVTAKRFKDNTEKLKREQFALYKSVEGMVAQQAVALNKMFPGDTGYKIPTDVSVDIVANDETYLAGGNIDPSLKLEDPKVYFEKMKTKLAAVKTSIEEQNTKVLAEVDAHRKKIYDNHVKEAGEWKALAAQCKSQIDGANAAAKAAYEQQMKMVGEKQSKDAEACHKVESFLANPSCDDIEGIGESALHVASLMGDQQALQSINEFKRSCHRFGSHDDGDASAYANVYDSNGPQDLDEYCKGEGNQFADCKKYIETLRLYVGTKSKKKICDYESKTKEDILAEFQKKVGSNENCVIVEGWPQAAGPIQTDSDKDSNQKGIKIYKCKDAGEIYYAKYRSVYPRGSVKDGKGTEDCADSKKESKEEMEEARIAALNIQNQDAINEIASDLSQVTTRACNAQYNQELSMKSMFDGMGNGMNPNQMMMNGIMPNG